MGTDLSKFSARVIERNPDLLKPHRRNAPQPIVEALPSQRRIRQDHTPKLNRLEAEACVRLRQLYPKVLFRAQAKRYRLANGVWYKPDFTAILDGTETAWEVKGPHMFRGGGEMIKTAAKEFPEVRWIFIWKEQRDWLSQIIIP